MTEKSRFKKLKGIWIGYDKSRKEFKFFDENIEGRHLSKKSNLFDIHWSACTEEYANGKKVKLMVS